MKIETDKSLQALNTFGIQAHADYYAAVTSVDDVRELMKHELYRLKKMVLGGGSNVLFTQNFRGLVIKNSIPGISVAREEDKEVIVTAGAGEGWHPLVRWCIDKNYAGLENLSLIPGQVGAAPMQNIGAYGVEIKDTFHELTAIDLSNGEEQRFGLKDCHFGYRESVFKHAYKDRFIITSVSFRLTNLNHPQSHYNLKMDYGDIKNTLAERSIFEPTIRDISDAVMSIRNSKLPNPKELGNAGSFFKNPVITSDEFAVLKENNPLVPSYPQPDGSVKVPAGWLIEQCGWKGKVVGHTGSHQQQALVLVNYGGATGEEVWQLAKDIQQSVEEKFNIHIHPEVNRV